MSLCVLVMRQCCTDHKGIPKRKYRTKEEAEKVAEQRNVEGVAVKVYACEEGDGWHLTSINAPPPERPKNAMTPNERARYTRKQRNLLGKMLDEELLNELQDKSQKNTLNNLEKQIEVAQQTLEEKKNEYQNSKKDFIEMRNQLKQAEQGVNEAKRKLSDAQLEYASAKRRIERQRKIRH